ncbi:MAG: PLP-dependent aminotransferase family protein [Selenomonas sp.]|uniref:MocR-like pyridoxine biosynthesis transcription factor PdxR n=1 Tax=Selenomonas sp. TaxID=2053611 RepID=UPI0025D987B4|nr:PLP-dependent aminotransferase family protein [Selenomonas sp.]MCI6231922.1 PLP-dependent aminotransferase family protein [Selenomonas sp.]
MLTYSFENIGRTPLYAHLYRCIRHDIETGVLSPGEKLPSKRALARHLGISTITVEGAYGQLMAEGYCTSQPKRGVYVSSEITKAAGAWPKIETSMAPPLGELSSGSETERVTALRDALTIRQNRESHTSLPSQSPFRVPVPPEGEPRNCRLPLWGRCPEGADKQTLGASAPSGRLCRSRQRVAPSAIPDSIAIDFAARSASAETFPFSIWTKHLRRVVADEAEALLARSPGQGVLALRQAIAGHLRRFRGLAVEPEQIVVGAGTEYLYTLLVQFFGRDRRFCVENPGYGRIRRIYESNGATCLSASLDSAGVRPQELVENGAQIVHISPSHHFPTGLIMPISRRYELLGWATGAPDRYIIEDDYDSEFRLTGRPIPTLMGIDALGRVLYMNTFSKSLTPTIRISYLVLPQALVQPFRERLGFYSCTVSNFEQYTLARFIEEGDFERHIHRMRTLYRKRRETILQLLKKSPFASHIEILEQGSGLHFLVRFRDAGSDESIEKKLAREGVRMKPLASYYAETTQPPKEAAGMFVLDYSAVDEEKMGEAVERIGRALY